MPEVTELNKTPIKVETKIKKKRGRKPKAKPTSPVIKVKKKRGRKPKEKTDEIKPKIRKKRGRKPKDKFNNVKNNENKFNLQKKTDNVIVHLSIHSKQLESDFVEKGLLTYNPEIPGSPKAVNELNSKGLCPYEKYIEDSSDNEVSESIDNNIFNLNISPKNDNIMKKDNNTIICNSCQNKCNNIDSVNNNLNDKKFFISHKDKWFDNEKSELNSNEMISNLNNHIKRNKTNNYDLKSIDKDVMWQFEECNKKKMFPKKTNIHCYWCCNSFDSVPCFLPYSYSKGTFKVFGCFCSPECAAAYNFKDNNDMDNVWERYSLLNLMYKKIYNREVDIKLAAPRMMLRQFGGNMSVEEFRKLNNNYNKDYHVALPPMISIIPKIQESYHKKTNKTDKSVFIPLDMKKVSKAQENLRLKRKVPSKNRNTLENCMKLKYV